MLYNVYGHIIPTDHREEADAMESLEENLTLWHVVMLSIVAAVTPATTAASMPLTLAQRDVPGFTLQGKPLCLSNDRSFNVPMAQAKRKGWRSHCSEFWVGSQPNNYPAISVDVVVFARPAGAIWGYGVQTRDLATSFSNGSGSRQTSGPGVGSERQWPYTPFSQYKPDSGYGVTPRRGRYLVSVDVTYFKGHGESTALVFRLARLLDARAARLKSLTTERLQVPEDYRAMSQTGHRHLTRK